MRKAGKEATKGRREEKRKEEAKRGKCNEKGEKENKHKERKISSNQA